MSGLSSWGGRTIQKLLKEFGSPEEIFAAKKLPVTPAQQEEADEAKRKAGTFPEELHTWEQQGVRFLTQDEEEFPKRLAGLPDSPFFLFVKGSLPPPGPAVAVVGARKCTQIGRAHV